MRHPGPDLVLEGRIGAEFVFITPFPRGDMDLQKTGFLDQFRSLPQGPGEEFSGVTGPVERTHIDPLRGIHSQQLSGPLSLFPSLRGKLLPGAPGETPLHIGIGLPVAQKINPGLHSPPPVLCLTQKRPLDHSARPFESPSFSWYFSVCRTSS